MVLAGLCRQLAVVQPQVLSQLLCECTLCAPQVRAGPAFPAPGTSLLLCVVTVNFVNLQRPEYPEAGISLLAPRGAAAPLSSHEGGHSPPPLGFSSSAAARLPPTSLPVEQMRE